MEHRPATCEPAGLVHGPILILYGLLGLYALEIVVPLLFVAFAWARSRARRSPLGRTV